MGSSADCRLLGEVCENLDSKRVPLSSRERANRKGAIPYYGAAGVIDYVDKHLFDGTLLLVGEDGSVINDHGKPIVQYVRGRVWVNNHAHVLRCSDDPDTRYLYYCLHTVLIKPYLSGSVQLKLTQGNLNRIPVPWPARRERHQVSALLGALDDKIDLNRRMCQTLEEMARALFKSWFVDFDPVRAKMEGRDPGLPKEIADLFPSRLVDSELGPIPEGWKSAALGDAFEASKGLSYKGSGLAESGMPLHNLNSVYEGGGYKHPGIKWYRGEYAERHLIKGGDVIVANTEQGHDRLLIGYAARVPREYDGPGLFSHHLYRLRPVQGSTLTSNWIYRLLNTRVMHETVSGYANGTTVNMLPIDGVQSPRFVSPPGTLVAVFDRHDEHWQARGAVAMRESESLQALRDTLLPKLISGEVRVPASLGSMQESST